MEKRQLASAVLKFSAKFVKELDKTKSVVSSPISTEILLAILALGASEPAHRELLTALGLPNDDAIRSSFSLLTSQLQSAAGVTLVVANKIYVNEHEDLDPQLKKDVVEIFDSSIEGVDFTDKYAASKRINEWVAKQTYNKIKNICSENDFTDGDQVGLFLVNAIYFKGYWRTRFKPDHTEDRAFRVDATKTILVPMMHYSGEVKFRHGHSEHLEAQILLLPYEDCAEMMVVLPNDVDGLDEVLLKLADGYDLMGEVDELYPSKIMINIPKFKIETEIDLNEVLKKLEMESMFKCVSNKMLKSKKPVRVSKAVQKAIIEVNEEGTEAAVATYHGYVLLSMPPSFDANHPFLYVLIGPGRTALFVGIYRGDDCAPRTDADITNRWNCRALRQKKK